MDNQDVEIIRTPEELSKYWDDFSQSYSENMEMWSSPLAHTLVCVGQINGGASILELGCGPGFATRLIRQANPSARIVATDISPQMLEIARKYMEPFSNEQIEFAESNAEALVFPDASFDRVLGNLCLMIVPSPESAIQECRRVLTDKGIAVFSVWGRPEYSSMFTIHQQVLDSMGIALPGPKVRSSFHLGINQESTRQLFLGAGFSQCLAWYQPTPLNVLDAQVFVRLFVDHMPYGRKVAQLIRETHGDEVMSEFERLLTQVVQSELDCGRPLQLDALVVVARV